MIMIQTLLRFIMHVEIQLLVSFIWWIVYLFNENRLCVPTSSLR